MNFEEELSRRTGEVEKIIEKYLPFGEDRQKTVIQAMNYSMRAGGKRLRPLLMQETFHLFGGRGESIEPFMAAIEMIHTSSLIHDDLPCMDNDEFRRGLPTTWVKFGYDMAVLAGDGLLMYAVETAVKSFHMADRPETVAECIRILVRKTGIHGMIGGQTVDVEMTDRPLSREILDFIYHLKTGALLEASMMIGACLGGAGEKGIQIAEAVAADVGLAFQIRDDILDVTGAGETLGKPIHSDEKNNKTTYVTLEGIQKAGKEVEAASGRAIRRLRSVSRETEFLEALIHMLVHREK